MNRFGALFIITHLVIVIPQVRHLLTEPRSLGLGITSLLFVIGLWMMRKRVETSNAEFFKNFDGANNGLFSLWLNIGRFMGTPIVAMLVGGFGLISLFTGTVHFFKGTPLMEIHVPAWVMVPDLIFALGVAGLMWGLHLRPEQAKEREASAGISDLLRELFIDIVIAIQANRFLFLLIDSLPKKSEDWVMDAVMLILISTVFFLPLQILVWRLQNSAISRWDVWKLVLLFTLAVLSLRLAPEGWLNLIRSW